MSRELATINEASPVEAAIECEIESRKLRWFELILVLLVALGQFFLASFYILTQDQDFRSYSQNIRWTGSLFHEVTSLLLLGYVLSRRKVRLRDLGLRWSFREFRAGLAVAIAAYMAYAIGYFIVHAIHHSLAPTAPNGPTAHDIFGHPSIFAVPYFLLNPFFEEMIVRAYLMSEIKALTGSWTLATTLSVLVQSSYHLYYGWVGALSLSFQFLVFSLYYARTRKATPLVIAHGIFDVYGFVRLL